MSACQCNAIKSSGNSINSISCIAIDKNRNDDNNKVNRNAPNTLKSNLEGGEIVEKLERNEVNNEAIEITAALTAPTNAKIENNNPKVATIIANNNAKIAKDVTKIASNIAKIANNNAKLNNNPAPKYSLFTKVDKDNKRYPVCLSVTLSVRYSVCSLLCLSLTLYVC